MQYIHHHTRTILSAYNGSLPLSHYLKSYFKKNPILGSRDRKVLTEMAYVFFRCAKGLPPQLSLDEKVFYGLLLGESNLPAMRRYLPESLQELYGQDFEHNAAVLAAQGLAFRLEDLLPYPMVFSEGIAREDWITSLLQRPLLFIRVAKQYMPAVKALLKQEGIDFKEASPDCLSLPNGTGVEKIIPAHMYRIQDASSQQTGTRFTMSNSDSCWDCCCGAGGKSLLLKERAPKAPLLVSDIRASILGNLEERFRLYSYPPPEQLLLSAADAHETLQRLGNRQFDHIVADVPCSGSGTWARTPEQLYFFRPESLTEYSERQKAIVCNASRFLKPGGTLYYITCSVFAKENEDVVDHLLSAHPELVLQEKSLINGTAEQADSMFIALFTRK